MRLWAMLTLCCLIVISVCSMNIDASDRFDAQSISDVLNRAKRQTEIRDDGPDPNVAAEPRVLEEPEVPPQDAATKAEREAEDADIQKDIAAAIDADKKEEIPVDEDQPSGEDKMNTFMPPDKNLKQGDIDAMMKNVEALENNAEIKAQLADAASAAQDAEKFPQQAQSATLTSRKINPYYHYWYRRQCPCEPRCCDTRKLTVNTDYRNPGITNADNVIGQCIQEPTRWPIYWKNPCYRTALLRFKFDKISRYPCPGLCVNSGMCGRRQLKLTFTLAPYYYRRAAYRRIMIHLANSKWNYGAKGDFPDYLYHDTNAVGANNLLMVHGHHFCQRTDPFYFWGAILPWVTQVSIYISHNNIKVTNNYGYHKEICDECLFKFNGEKDKNENCDSLWVGINRPVSYNGFHPYALHGAGVCKLEANWVCPWEYCCDDYGYGYPYYYPYSRSATFTSPANGASDAPTPGK